MRFQKTVAAGLALALAPLTALAELSARPDPADPTVAVPALRYVSAFDGYLAYQDQPPGSWRGQNEAMGQVGGHAGHLKSGVPAPADARPAPSAPASGRPSPSADHGAHGQPEGAR
jgi:hypothetical protein